MPRTRDLAIFVATTDRRQTTDKNDCFTLVHACEVIMLESTWSTVVVRMSRKHMADDPFLVPTLRTLLLAGTKFIEH